MVAELRGYWNGSGGTSQRRLETFQAAEGFPRAFFKTTISFCVPAKNRSRAWFQVLLARREGVETKYGTPNSGRPLAFNRPMIACLAYHVDGSHFKFA